MQARLIIIFSLVYTSKLPVHSLNSNYLPSAYLFAHNCDLSQRLQLLWKLWILQSYSWRTRHGLTIFGTLKQEGLILISLLHYYLQVHTLIKAFIYPFEEQLLTITFLVTDSNRLLTQSLFFLFIKLLVTHSDTNL